MLVSFLTQMFAVLVYQLIGVAIFLPLELALPKSRVPIRDRARGILFLLAVAPITAVVGLSVSSLGHALGIRPVVLASGFGGPVIASVVLALWADLQFYIVHRLEHRFLWRFHRVHHSIRNLSAANSYHHWTEPIWLGIMIGLPLMFVQVKIAPTLGILSAIFHWQQFYIHTSTKPHFGPLRWLLIDNHYHRIHHSTDPAHYGRNFGAMTPLWDWLFGTLYMPKSNEWPDVGLREVDEPRSFAEWAAWPKSSALGERRNKFVAWQYPDR